MRVPVACLVLLAIVVAAGSNILHACGDKFLLLGRVGARFQQAYAAVHPASILLVLPSPEVKHAPLRDSRLQAALKMAGHRVQVVQQADLVAALSDTRLEIILAERAEAARIRDLASHDLRKPALVVVVYELSSTDLAAVRREFDLVLNTPMRLPQILNLIDDTMGARLSRLRATNSGH